MNRIEILFFALASAFTWVEVISKSKWVLKATELTYWQMREAMEGVKEPRLKYWCRTLLSRKPFNCLKCMTGWIALILAACTGADYFLLYLPAGLFTGAIFSAIQMRYL